MDIFGSFTSFWCNKNDILLFTVNNVNNTNYMSQMYKNTYGISRAEVEL